MTYEEYLLTLPQFPKLLGAPDEPAYAIELKTPVMSTTMSTGRSRNRKSHYSKPSAVNCTYAMSAHKKMVLDAFISDKEQLNEGSKKFRLDVYWDTCEFMPCVVEFHDPSSPYRAVPKGLEWVVTLKIKILKKPEPISFELASLSHDLQEFDSFCRTLELKGCKL